MDLHPSRPLVCDRCGAPVPAADARFCLRCGEALAPDRGGAVVRANTGPGRTAPVRPYPGPGPVLVLAARTKSAGLAAVLSFFWCGLGQIYNGEIAKGVLFMLVYAGSWLLIWTLILLPVGVVTTPLLWIWGMADAYGAAERLNRHHERDLLDAR